VDSRSLAWMAKTTEQGSAGGDVFRSVMGFAGAEPETDRCVDESFWAVAQVEQFTGLARSISVSLGSDPESSRVEIGSPTSS